MVHALDHFCDVRISADILTADVVLNVTTSPLSAGWRTGVLLLVKEEKINNLLINTFPSYLRRGVPTVASGRGGKKAIKNASTSSLPLSAHPSRP